MTNDKGSVSVYVQQLIAGDKDVPVEKLWERYFHRLVALARVQLKNQPRRVADEEDVALSAFQSFCEGAVRRQFPQMNDRDNLWRVLVTITARKVYKLNVSAGRKKRGNNKILDEGALSRPGHDDSGILRLEQFIAREPTPEFAAQAVDEYQRLFALLDNEELRKIAHWKMEGFTNSEIAVKLGCAPRTVERRLILIRSRWPDPESA